LPSGPGRKLRESRKGGRHDRENSAERRREGFEKRRRKKEIRGEKGYYVYEERRNGIGHACLISPLVDWPRQKIPIKQERGIP
jgi:hypothetical protein